MAIGKDLGYGHKLLIEGYLSQAPGSPIRQYECHLSVAVVTETDQPMGENPIYQSISFSYLAAQLKRLEMGKKCKVPPGLRLDKRTEERLKSLQTDARAEAAYQVSRQGTCSI